mgnify:CR=1 FL=1
MALPLESTVHSTNEDPEFLEAFMEAIQDQEKRKQIISILERVGLLPSADRLPA